MSRLRETLQQQAGHQLPQQGNTSKSVKKSVHQSSHKKLKRK